MMAEPEVNYSDARVPCKICGRNFAPEVLAKHNNVCKKTAASAAKRKPFDSSKQRVIEGELSLKQIKQAQKKLEEMLPQANHRATAFRGIMALQPKEEDSNTSVDNPRAADSLSVLSSSTYYLDELGRNVGDPFDETASSADGRDVGDLLDIDQEGCTLDIKPPKTHWREKHQDFMNAVKNARGVQKAIDSGGPLPPPPPPSINPDYVQCPYCSRRFSPQASERHINFCKEQQARLPRAKPNPVAVSKQNTRLTYQAPKPKAKSPAAAPPPSVPAARGVATRAPPGGASRGRAAPAPDNEDVIGWQIYPWKNSCFKDVGAEFENSRKVLPMNLHCSSKCGRSYLNPYINIRKFIKMA
ncbi:unnamed protein product [Lymnaea stagnalis]|uniref:C2HC/C3H-type domain-containing protein n=1 Tax=Lymnaea stagnalis TaxID=6523 RepID=A0AAV2I8W4_LYMST